MCEGEVAGVDLVVGGRRFSVGGFFGRMEDGGWRG